MPKSDFSKVEITLRHGCPPVNLLHIFRTPFLKNTSGRLHLKIQFKIKTSTEKATEIDMPSDEQSLPEPSINIRPKRTCRQPSYLKDYVQ